MPQTRDRQSVQYRLDGDTATLTARARQGGAHANAVVYECIRK